MRSHACLVPLVLFLTSGCMQYLVQPPAPSIAGNPQKVAVKSYLGSEVQQPPYVLAKTCVDGEQLARVLVKRDAVQGFVSWITLGLVAPATVVYECANLPRPAGGSTDEAAPNGGAE
jgi:hypothetical protein